MNNTDVNVYLPRFPTILDEPNWVKAIKLGEYYVRKFSAVHPCWYSDVLDEIIVGEGIRTTEKWQLDYHLIFEPTLTNVTVLWQHPCTTICDCKSAEWVYIKFSEPVESEIRETNKQFTRLVYGFMCPYDVIGKSEL